MKKYDLYRLYFQVRHPELRGLFDIPTHLTDREKIALFRAASEVSEVNRMPFCCVEIGSYMGASSAYIAAGIARQNRPGRVFCVDTWNNDAMSEGYRDTMAEFLRNTERFSRYIVPLRGLSTDPAVIGHVKRAAQTIDLLFIDGDHSFEGVLADWETYSPLLAEISVIAMHDIGWAEGVQRVVVEEIKPRVVRECRLPNLWWGWVKK